MANTGAFPRPVNLIDKIVTVFSPSAGLRRQRDRSHLAMSGAWTGARWDRNETKSWWTTQGSADADTLMDLQTLRMRCRDLVRNSALAGGAVNNVVKNTVGTGLSAHPYPDFDYLGWTPDQAADWATRMQRLFESWADSKDSDLTRTSNFYQAQSLVERSSLESGDCFTLLPMRARKGRQFKTCYQIIEADRVGRPDMQEGLQAQYGDDGAKTTGRVWGGIEVDDDGAPVSYLICRQHPGDLSLKPDALVMDRYPAFGDKTGRKLVLHHFDRERPDQHRGVPFIAPVIEHLKQLSRYTDAEIMAAVVSAFFTVFVKTPDGNGLGQFQPTVTAGGAGVVSGQKPGETGLGNGTIVDLAPGEEIETANPNRPNTAFDPFVQAILRQIGVRLNIPFEVLVMHFTASYSAARAALLEAWKFFKLRRVNLAINFCQPFYEAVMDEAVSLGLIEAPGYFQDAMLRRAYQRCEWVGDAPGQINPKDETAAAEAKIEAGLSSIEREAMKLEGVSWLDIHRQRAREHKMRVAAGLEPEIGNARATETLVASQAEPTPAPDGTDIEKPEDQQ